MISEQIIEDYLEQESNYEDKMMRLKISLLLISLVALLFLSTIS